MKLEKMTRLLIFKSMNSLDNVFKIKQYGLREIYKHLNNNKRPTWSN
jgi:hypothetical protein